MERTALIATLKDRQENNKCAICGIEIGNEDNYTPIQHHLVGEVLVHKSHLKI